MITGGIKFFDRPPRFGDTGVFASASSGDNISAYMLDKNPATSWRSVGSTDAVTETLEINFPDRAINRLHLRAHNFKGFTVRYDVGGNWTHFTSVTGMLGALPGGIVETAFSETSAYYEFDQVTTGKLLIEVTTSQTTNAQKYLTQVIATTEIGTLQGFPAIKVTNDRNPRTKEMLSGRMLVTKSDDVFSCALEFKNYPARFKDDLDLVYRLYDSDVPFLVWLCGGRGGEPYFRYTIRGMRLDDIFLMQCSNRLQPQYWSNIYTLPVDVDVTLLEHV